MATQIVTPATRDAILARHGLDRSPRIMTPEEAERLARPAHISVEGTYHEAHFEMENFECLRLEGDLYKILPNIIRYRVEGLLMPGAPPEMIACGYNGPELTPFVIEALTHGRPAKHPGVQARAYRSPGVWERNGYGEHTEPRVSSVDVLTGHKDGVL